jgi:hypothetical protein
MFEINFVNLELSKHFEFNGNIQIAAI